MLYLVLILLLLAAPLAGGLSFPVSRRAALVTTAGSLSTGILPGVSSATPSSSQTILLTGATPGGIGFEAAKRFLSVPGTTVILPARTLAKSTSTVAALEGLPGKAIAAECDLGSLASIAAFVATLKGTQLDTICLNAGLAPSISQKTVSRTADGFEETVGVNHFGHFALMEYGVKGMLKKGGRVVITASGVHDPDSPGGKQGSLATLGELEGLETLGRSCEMINGGPYDPDKAYKDSKLCNVFFTRELQRRCPELSVNCFTPGLIVGTGLFRNQNKVFTKVFDVAATNLLRVGESVEWGGGALAYMALSSDLESSRGKYYGAKPGASKDGEAGESVILHGDLTSLIANTTRLVAAFGTSFNVDAVSKEVIAGEAAGRGKRLWELSESLTKL